MSVPAPPHGVRCLKAERLRSVWLVQRPGEPATTVKSWPLTPALVVKLLLRRSQPQRQARAIGWLERAGIPTTPVVRPWRLAWRGGRVMVDLELVHAPGQTVYELLEAKALGGQAGRRVGQRVGELTAAMASARLFHDDLKVDNLVVEPGGGEVVVIDTTSVKRSRAVAAAVAEMLWKLGLVPREDRLAVPGEAWRAAMLAALRPLSRADRREVVQRLRAMNRR